MKFLVLIIFSYFHLLQAFLPSSKTCTLKPIKQSSQQLHSYHFGLDEFQNVQTFFNHMGSVIPTSLEIPSEVAISDDEMEAVSSLSPLGKDLMAFLFATIGIVPLFKKLNASPVIGFLAAGLIMGPAGLHVFSDLNDMESIADFGVLFLLFEQGLELTVERLRSLSKFAFGMGTLQVLLCTGAFFMFPFIGGVQFLEFFVGSQPALVDITRLDESVVIGLALSLSSSAFCLKILQEKNQLTSNFGSASLGILLLQDIAVVPLLVLLPIIESSTGPMTLTDQAAVLGITFAKALFGLGGIIIFGGRIVRYLFSLVAQTKSSETFVALCLVVALGTGALTDWLGLSSTLGAFTAGTLLAESNYRTQIESDIKPFRGLLLGLFFITTGASVQPNIIQDELPTVLALLTGLIAFKAVIITSLGPLFQLSKTESIRTGMLLSGGGEFAFVVLTLADKLHVLPDKLAKILVGVVVLSMALTPYLSNLGDIIANEIEKYEAKNNIKKVNELFASASTESSSSSATSESSGHSEVSIREAVVICGFDTLGSSIAAYLSDPTVRASVGDQSTAVDYVGFDLDPELVISGFRKGQRVLYGDASQPAVLLTAGVQVPRAFVVTYSEQEIRLKTVEKLREAFPDTPIITRTEALDEYYELLDAGASTVCVQERESSLNMFSSLVSSLGLSVVPKGFNPQQADSAPLAGLVQYLRTGSDSAVKETILRRRQEKSVEYLSTDRESVSDTTYFERFRQSLLRPFSTPPKSPQVESLLFEVNRQVQGFLGSTKLRPDDAETSKESIKASVDTSFVESSASDQVMEIQMGSRGQVQLIQRETEIGMLMTPEQLLEVLEDSTSGDLKNALVCPLPPRPLAATTEIDDGSIDSKVIVVGDIKKKS